MRLVPEYTLMPLHHLRVRGHGGGRFIPHDAPHPRAEWNHAASSTPRGFVDPLRAIKSDSPLLPGFPFVAWRLFATNHLASAPGSSHFHVHARVSNRLVSSRVGGLPRNSEDEVVPTPWNGPVEQKRIGLGQPSALRLRPSECAQKSRRAEVHPVETTEQFMHLPQGEIMPLRSPGNHSPTQQKVRRR